VLSEAYLINNLVERTRYGVITKYYQNSLTTNPDNLEKDNEVSQLNADTSFQPNERAECTGGACSL
jgi:hypothetical protein